MGKDRTLCAVNHFFSLSSQQSDITQVAPLQTGNGYVRHCMFLVQLASLQRPIRCIARRARIFETAAPDNNELSTWKQS